MKCLTIILSFTLLTSIIHSQCDAVLIPKTTWNISYFDSEEPNGEGVNNGHAIHAIDGDSTTFWHTQWQAAQTPYPHEIQINLGSIHNVNGISLLSRYNNPYGKPKSYEIYLSLDGVNWQNAQSKGDFMYNNINAMAQRTYKYFGSISAQYVKIILLSSYGDYYYSVISEIDVYESFDCPATGQNNQLANFESISKKYTTDPSFSLNANTNSGLPITFTIVSGPASINGNTLSLNGTAGTVIVKASQTGNTNYYPWEETQSFEVVDLSIIKPEIKTKFTEEVDLKMSELSPYLLHSYASIAEPEQLTISSIEYLIDGTSQLSQFKDNSYQHWWTPSHYGLNQIIVKATGSNGIMNYDTLNIKVSNTINDTNSITYQNDVIDIGTIGSQWFYGTYTLPQFVGAFDTIMANFSISCPNVSGGCDDWDRLGWTEIKAPNGDWVELFRYITPYGVPCGQSIDVTDFSSILQGKVEFRMYIETWGTGGWKLNLNLDYKKGEPIYKYSSVSELWHGDYSFGNPADLQPTGLRKVKFENEVQDAKIRLVSTGHGWGSNNTGNAAEFFHAVHHIYVDSINTFEQDLWQDCNPNPASCTGQQGTWQYDRAGWCPGSMGKVYSYNMSQFVNLDSINLNYIFQESYMDQCHPNNPDCVSGTTCSDCNASYNPYYRVGSYLIKYSNSPINTSSSNLVENKEIKAILYPNPTENDFKIQLNDNWRNIVISIYNVSGNIIQTKYFSSEKELNSFQFSTREISEGIYFLKIQSEGQFSNYKIIKK